MQKFNLNKLKQNIEQMSLEHQINVFKVLKKSTTVHINENKNGSFINLSSLNENDLNSLFEYTAYVKEQQNTIAEIEYKKNKIEKKYFNNNKDKGKSLDIFIER